VSVAKTAGGRMGGTISDEMLVTSSAFIPPRGRTPRDAMTTPAGVALDACDTPVAPLPRCTT
jgi:hypothetical protein